MRVFDTADFFFTLFAPVAGNFQSLFFVILLKILDKKTKRQTKNQILNSFEFWKIYQNEIAKWITHQNEIEREIEIGRGAFGIVYKRKLRLFHFFYFWFCQF